MFPHEYKRALKEVEAEKLAEQKVEVVTNGVANGINEDLSNGFDKDGNKEKVW